MNSSVQIWNGTCDKKMKGKCKGSVMMMMLMMMMVVVVAMIVVVEVQPETGPPSSGSGP